MVQHTDTHRAASAQRYLHRPLLILGALCLWWCWWLVVVAGGGGWWWWLGSCLANCALLTLSVLVTDALVIPVLVCADSVSVQSVV